MKKELIVHKDPKSPNSEIFRTLRTNIQFMNTNKKLKTLLVTSTYPGEGKSWISSNLAVTFAQAGKKVILIDADMRKGRQFRIFDIAPTPGLSNYLSETEIDDKGNASRNAGEYVQETGVENLYVVAAGNIPPNPSELLVSSQMIKFIDDLKEFCDLVIIDGTPCELVADSIILSRIVDSTIIVTAHKITKKDVLERVIKNIKNVGGNLAGVVINKVPVAKGYDKKYYYYGKSSNGKSLKNGTSKRSSRSNIDRFENNVIKLQNDINATKEAKNNNKVIFGNENYTAPEEVSGYKTAEETMSYKAPNETVGYNNTPDNATGYNKSDNTTVDNTFNNTANYNASDNATGYNNTASNNSPDESDFLTKTNKIMEEINSYLNEEKNNLN